jgi:hypothetical protein
MTTSRRADAPSCPFCKTAMEEGFVIDRQHHSLPRTQTWAEGKPEKSFWRGLKLKGKRVLEVTTWRCPRCGLLHSFAI